MVLQGLLTYALIFRPDKIRRVLPASSVLRQTLSAPRKPEAPLQALVIIDKNW